MLIEAKLRELGPVLPEPPKLPPGITISFVWTRRHGNRVYLSGHALLAAVRDRLCTIITVLGKEAPARGRPPRAIKPPRTTSARGASR